MKKYMRKYEAGELITSLDELYEQENIIFYGKTINHGFFGSWQMRFAKGQLELGVINKAVKKEVPNENKK